MRGTRVGMLALWAILIYVGYAGMVFVAQRGMLYPAPRSVGDIESAPLPRGVERILIHPEGSKTQAWFLPSPVTTSARLPVVIFAHGNGERIEDWWQAFGPLREAGVSVLLVEYPGYGYSEGTPTQTSITETMVLAYDAMRAHDRVDPQRIVGMGRSLGGGAILALSERRQLSHIILQSTFSGIRPFARRFLVPGFLVRDPYDNVQAIREYEGPVLILHGDDDSMIPFAHAQTLVEANTRAVLVPLACGHNDCPPDWTAYWQHILGFLAERGVLEDAAAKLP